MSCVLGLMCYVVAAVLLHKLDQLELRRAAVVPFCGKDGLFKYEVQVKTGWSRGAGERLRGDEQRRRKPLAVSLSFTVALVLA